MKKELVKDYIETLHNINAQSSDQQIRPNIFYSPQLDELVFMEKNVGTKLKVSNIHLYLMAKKECLKNVNLSNMSLEERKTFILENLHNLFVYNEVAIAYMSNFKNKDNWNDVTSPFTNKLSILKVNPYFRRYGLASELIKELKSDSINNGMSTIKAKMSPLDNFDFSNSIHINNCYKLLDIAKNTGPVKAIQLQTLAEIYSYLGFEVPKDFITNNQISMTVDKHSIPAKDQYPASFTSYCIEPPTILVR